MDQFTIPAEVRTKLGKGAAYQLRQAGKIPAIYYGKGKENLNVAINPLDLEKAVASEKGMNTIIQLKVPGKGDYNVLLKDYQAHPIKRHFLHADFMFVDLTKKVEVDVPIHLIGKSIGVKEGGILEQLTRELKVTCLPHQIPKQIEVDITDLKIGMNLHLDDLKLPAGVELIDKLNVPIAAVVAQKEEEVLTPGTLVEPEVLTAKKEGEEGAAPAAGGDAKDAKAKDAKAAPKAEKAGEKK